ncbi:MAG: HAD hydrolase-like protein [Verrucomicrobia bacterium]|nr:HAD hydrolase-like protein [Verrucomicrobiota bacterium]
MVRLVLFDIDGTLILSGGAGEKAFAQVCETEFGIPNGTANLNFAGRTDTSIIREFFNQFQIAPSPANFQRFLDHYVFRLDHLLGQLRGTVLPGVHAMLRNLEALPEQPLLGLLTGNIRLGAQIKLTHYHLWTCFRTGAFADDHEDRNQIAAVARDRGNQLLGRDLDGSEILVIGDTPRDVECANAIGARSIAVATGKFSREELLREKANWTVETLMDVSVREVCA